MTIVEIIESSKDFDWRTMFSSEFGLPIAQENSGQGGECDQAFETCDSSTQCVVTACPLVCDDHAATLHSLTHRALVGHVTAVQSSHVKTTDNKWQLIGSLLGVRVSTPPSHLSLSLSLSVCFSSSASEPLCLKVCLSRTLAMSGSRGSVFRITSNNNKLCAWRHNMPPPPASWQYLRNYSPGGTSSGMLAI